MLETINTTTSTVAANGVIPLGSASIEDNNNRMTLSGDSILLRTPGKYKIEASFAVYSLDLDTITIQMYANGTAIGIPVTVTVPATGYEEISLQKTIPTIPASYGSVASITFVTSTGGVITNSIVDVYKRS